MNDAARPRPQTPPSHRTRIAYAATALLLVVIEMAIGAYAEDAFVRPYVGDALAVPLIYACARATTSYTRRALASATLAFAYAIELAQGVQLLRHLHLAEVPWLVFLLGSVFDVGDLYAYTAGFALIGLGEYIHQPETFHFG